MRRITWIKVLVVLMLLPALADAEPRSRAVQHIFIGGKVGVEFAKFVGTDTEDGLFEHSYKPGFQVGVTGGAQIFEHLAIAAEILFSRKGSRLDSMSAAMSDGDYLFDYIEIPAIAQIGLPVSDRVRPYAAFGPAISILLDAEYVQTDGMRFELSSGKAVVWSFVFGLGTLVKINESGALMFDARYDWGLTSRSDFGDSTNHSFYVTIGYQTDLRILSGTH
jgi:hypothetical protein